MIYIMSGICGSGKSTYAFKKGWELGIEVVSSDHVKMNAMSEMGYRSYTHPSQIPGMTPKLQRKIDKTVWRRVFSRLIRACKDDRDIILDAASLQVKFIERYKVVADKYNKGIHIIIMDTPVEVAWDRNVNRVRVVPMSVFVGFACDSLNNTPKIKELFSYEEVYWGNI